MKVFNMFILIGLTCSLLVTSMNLAETNTEWLDWINLIGCVFLGAHIREMFFET